MNFVSCLVGNYGKYNQDFVIQQYGKKSSYSVLSNSEEAMIFKWGMAKHSFWGAQPHFAPITT